MATKKPNLLVRAVWKLGRIIGPAAHQVIYRPLAWLLNRCGYRLLNVSASRFTRIGHLALEPDCFLKEQALLADQGVRPCRAVVFAPSNRVANRHLAKYLRQHCVVVTSPWLCSLLRPLLTTRVVEDTSRFCEGINVTAECYDIYARWGDRPALFTLSDEDHRFGRQVLREMGLPDDAWFVCVHCREDGYAPEALHNYRDGDIGDYTAAIEEIASRGGWCIRVGDPTMKPLPPLENVVDYALSRFKSERMDVFLCARCRFFLGNSSGLFVLSSVFGVPCAVVNLAPLSMMALGPRDLGIPKLVESITDRRLLTFAEILNSPIGDFRYTHLFDEAGVRAVDNSPQDIYELTVEMLDRLEGTAIYDADDHQRQQAFHSLLRPGHYGYRSCSRVGRDFLHKYQYLLLTERTAGGILHDESSQSASMLPNQQFSKASLQASATPNQ